MAGYTFDSWTRDFDITIFASERAWERENFKISSVFQFWFCCSLRIFPFLAFVFRSSAIKMQAVFRDWYTIISSLERGSSRRRFKKVTKCTRLFYLCNRMLHHFTVNSSHTWLIANHSKSISECEFKFSKVILWIFNRFSWPKDIHSSSVSFQAVILPCSNPSVNSAFSLPNDFNKTSCLRSYCNCPFLECRNFHSLLNDLDPEHSRELLF